MQRLEQNRTSQIYGAIHFTENTFGGGEMLVQLIPIARIAGRVSPSEHIRDRPEAVYIPAHQKRFTPEGGDLFTNARPMPPAAPMIIAFIAHYFLL
jgi:hypothetical protein